ncbi:MAG: TspO/MBR family protein [Candidatus Nanopelagicaceae bacterium]
MEFKTIATTLGIILVLIYAGGSGIWVNTSPGWYTSLNRPSWQPPDFVFGLIWPYNFLVIGFTVLHVVHNQSRNTAIAWLTIFALSVIFALNWAYQFYVPHNLQIAATSLIFTAILTLPLTFLTYKSSVIYRLLFSPYQIWVITAAALSFSYAARN